MANPLIAQGTLNRLLASVLFPDFPQLNITPSYLAPEAIDCTPDGQSTAIMPSMTGVVTSPEPYQTFRVAVHLLKSQAFAASWKLQIETNTLLGACTIRPDSRLLTPFDLDNVSIVGLDRMSLGGRDNGFVVNLMGVWYINSALWE